MNFLTDLSLKRLLMDRYFGLIEANPWELGIRFKIAWRSHLAFPWFILLLFLLYFLTIFWGFATKMMEINYLLRSFSGDIYHFVGHVILGFHDFDHGFKVNVWKADVVSKPSAGFG